MRRLATLVALVAGLALAGCTTATSVPVISAPPDPAMVEPVELTIQDFCGAVSELENGAEVGFLVEWGR